MRAGDRRTSKRLDLLLERAHVSSMLFALDGKPDHSWGVKELAKEMKVHIGWLGGLARHVERFGLVEVETKEGVAGQPAYSIRITQEGRQWVARMRAPGSMLPEPRPAKEPIRRRGPRTRA